jgi:hypothetical protein
VAKVRRAVRNGRTGGGVFMAEEMAGMRNGRYEIGVLRSLDSRERRCSTELPVRR